MTAEDRNQVADRVYRLGTKWVNLYLVEDGGDYVVVDSGYPGYFSQITAFLEARDPSPEQVQAILVTHHHVDHAGTAEQLRERGARVLVGAEDEDKVCGDAASHPPSGFYRQIWRPSMIAYLAHTVAVGGAKYRPVDRVETVRDATLDLPGAPRIIQTPGHTAGHYSVALDERGILFTGDALVNFDYASGRRGVGLHRFNEDRGRALESLERLIGLDADLVLFGHGDPWTDGVAKAVELAREKG